MGGVMGKYPPCQEEGQTGVFLPDMEYSYPYKEGPLSVEGWLIPSLYQMSQHPLQQLESRKTRIAQQPEHEDVLTKRKGGEP